MLQHKKNRKECISPYEKVIVQPLRNKISLFLNDNVNIIIPEIQLLIHFFRNNISKNPYITIQITNMNDISLIFICDFTEHDICHILNIIPHNTRYLCINNVNYINHRLRETYFDTIIYRSSNSFHQCDENIRIYLYNEIKKIFEIQYDTFIFVGGEMYIFGKLFVNNTKIFYSDFASIVNDTKINIDTKYIYQVDYSTITLTIPEHTYQYGSAILINTNNGITERLCQQIFEHNIKYVYIISCKYNAIIKNIKMLSNKYVLTKFINIKSNYDICFLMFINNI